MSRPLTNAILDFRSEVERANRNCDDFHVLADKDTIDKLVNEMGSPLFLPESGTLKVPFWYMGLRVVPSAEVSGMVLVDHINREQQAKIAAQAFAQKRCKQVEDQLWNTGLQGLFGAPFPISCETLETPPEPGPTLWDRYVHVVESCIWFMRHSFWSVFVTLAVVFIGALCYMVVLHPYDGAPLYAASVVAAFCAIPVAFAHAVFIARNEDQL